jgi:hypothetical protein
MTLSASIAAALQQHMSSFGESVTFANFPLTFEKEQAPEQAEALSAIPLIKKMVSITTPRRDTTQIWSDIEQTLSLQHRHRLYHFLSRALSLKDPCEAGKTGNTANRWNFLHHILSNVSLASSEIFREEFLDSIPDDVTSCDPYRFALCILKIDLVRRCYLAFSCHRNYTLADTAAFFLSREYFKNMERKSSETPLSQLKIYLYVHRDQRFSVDINDILFAAQVRALPELTPNEMHRICHSQEIYLDTQKLAEFLIRVPRWIYTLNATCTAQYMTISTVYEKNVRMHGAEVANQTAQRQYVDLTQSIVQDLKLMM